MANQRSSSWFYWALVALAGSAAQPAAAKPLDLSLYPLRVHIFQSEWKAGGNYFGEGSGVANLIDGQQIHGFDFAYECPINYMKSVGNQAYVARWKKPEKTLEIVGGKVGSQDKSDTCEFRITLHDYVYDIQDGTLSTFTQEQYKVRVGMVLPQSIDADLSHYPLRLSVLKIDWAPRLNGTRIASGQGNLRTPAGLSSVDFTTNCNATFSTTPANRYYPVKWIQEGSMMTALLRASGASAASFVCILKTSVHTDIYVLDASGAAVKAVSQEEYRRVTSNTITPPAPQPTLTAPAPLPKADPSPPDSGTPAAPLVGTPVTRQPVPGIAVPALRGMPFTAETNHLLSRQVDGAIVTTQMHGIIARDSQGRVHFENHRYTTDSEPPEKSLTRFTIEDPVARTSTGCDVATHICQITDFQAPSPVAVELSHPVQDSATPKIANPTPVLIDNGRHLLTLESVGTRTIDNLPATGTRRTTSLAPGVSPADPAGNLVVESWFSPDLQVNLSEIRNYPNEEVQEHSLKILSRTEPDPSLFAIPAGFTIQDDRGKMPTIQVQKNLKMANNNMPNIGMPNSPLIGTSMGNGSGSGVPGGLRKIGGGVSVPVVTYQVAPEFTEAARKAKLIGVVLVNLIVDRNGLPQNVHVLRSLVGPDGKPDPKVSKEVADGLGQKAVDSVKQYKFKPAMEDGKPVAVELNVEVNFQVF